MDPTAGYEHAEGGSRSLEGGRAETESDKPEITCEFCGGVDHLEEDCPHRPDEEDEEGEEEEEQDDDDDEEDV